MNGFFWIFLAICVLALLYDFTKSSQTRIQIYYIACSFLILLCVAQESTVSPDFLNYCAQFEWIRETGWVALWNYGWEQGFVYFVKLCTVVFHDPRTIVLLLSLFIFVPLFRLFYKHSAMPMLSILSFIALGFLGTAMGIFRQWCAMAVLIPSFQFIKDRRPALFLLNVLAAALFHRTAAVFAVMYIIYLLPINRKLLMWSGITAIALALLGYPILQVLNQFARIPEAGNYNGGITMLIVLWVFVFLAYYFLQDRMDKGHVKLMFMMLLTAATIQPVAFTFSNWARIVWYFSISLTLLIPELHVSICRHTKKNKLLIFAHKLFPDRYQSIQTVFQSKWFYFGTQLALMAVLFVWLLSVVENSYAFAPI